MKGYENAQILRIMQITVSKFISCMILLFGETLLTKKTQESTLSLADRKLSHY